MHVGKNDRSTNTLLCEADESKMDQKPDKSALVSVIVVTYNHGTLIFDTLDSVFKQDYPNIELIVAEDGCKDFDLVAVETYICNKKSNNIYRYNIIQPPSNQGTVRNINNALRYAHGSYIKIIAGDDIYPDSCVVTQQINYLESHPHDDLVIGNTLECDSELNVLPKEGITPVRLKKLLFGPRQKLLRYVCKKELSVVSTQVSCYRKAFFDKYGCYDERYRLIEDIPMAVRIVSNNIGIGYIDYPCVCHRKGTGISTSRNAFDKSRIAYYYDLEKCFENAFLPIKSAIGVMYVNMRHRLIKFRIQYALLNGEAKAFLPKALLVIKNIFPIVYYTVCNISRIGFYFGNRRKESK